MNQTSAEITRLLNETTKGDVKAESLLLEVVYGELRRVAARRMRHERSDHTLEPTALVNEAYIRLFDQPHRTWVNRTHFFALAARVMRNILIDHARRHASQKQGGVKVPVENISTGTAPTNSDLIALNAALDKLSKRDPRQVRIVELRFFGGLTEEEIAQVLNIGTRTVQREWAVARAWLRKELSNAI